MLVNSCSAWHVDHRKNKIGQEQGREVGDQHGKLIGDELRFRDNGDQETSVSATKI